MACAPHLTNQTSIVSSPRVVIKIKERMILGALKYQLSAHASLFWALRGSPNVPLIIQWFHKNTKWITLLVKPTSSHSFSPLLKKRQQPLPPRRMKEPVIIVRFRWVQLPRKQSSNLAPWTKELYVSSAQVPRKRIRCSKLILWNWRRPREHLGNKEFDIE